MAYTKKETALQKLQEGEEYSSKKFDYFRSDKEVIFEAIKIDSKNINGIVYNLKTDRDFVLEAVKVNGMILENLRNGNHNYSNDKEVVFEAVKQNGQSYIYADTNLKQDKELLMLAVSTYGGAIHHTNEKYLYDREVVLEASKHPGFNLEKVEKFQNDKEIVLNAVCSQPYNANFSHASYELRCDKEVVLTSIKYGNPSYDIGYDLKNEIGDRPIVPYLESCVLADKLQSQLLNKQELKPTRKMKI